MELPADQYLAAIPIAAILVDPDSRVDAANEKARQLNPNLSPGRSFIHAFRAPALVEAVETCLRDRAPSQAIYDRAENGVDTRYDVSCTYLDGRDIHGALICFQDISGELQLGEIRRDFVANVSHELRSPLTALQGFIETLRGPARGDPEATARFLEIMEGEATRMNRLVQDLLSLSRVEDGARVRPTDIVDLDAILRSVMRTLGPQADENRATLVDAIPQSPVRMVGDADQLTQVFTNIIENAVKYGGQGGEVTVSVHPVERDPVLRRAAVSVSVTDTGPGIDAVHIPRLTERFYRVDTHRSREKGGTGLGLAIVKHIVNRHRGRLRIQSEPGKGSVFNVILPLSP